MSVRSISWQRAIREATDLSCAWLAVVVGPEKRCQLFLLVFLPRSTILCVMRPLAQFIISLFASSVRTRLSLQLEAGFRNPCLISELPFRATFSRSSMVRGPASSYRARSFEHILNIDRSQAKSYGCCLHHYGHATSSSERFTAAQQHLPSSTLTGRYVLVQRTALSSGTISRSIREVAPLSSRRLRATFYPRHEA